MHLLLAVEFVVELLMGLVLMGSHAEMRLWDSWRVLADEAE
jgi:hypothetical protein